MFRYCLKLFLLVAAVVLFCTGLPAAAKAEMRIFELQHRPVSELAEMVRSLLGEEAKVAAFHNTLAVNASPDALDEVARLVASFDRARQMLRVTIDQGKSFTEDEFGVSTSGRLLHDNNLVIINPGTKKSRDPGASLFLDSGQSRLKLRGTDSRLRESRRVSQYISVLEGEPALVSVGRAVPFTNVMLSYCRRHPAFIETTTYEHVDTGFEVLPVLTWRLGLLWLFLTQTTLSRSFFMKWRPGSAYPLAPGMSSEVTTSSRMA